MTEPLPPVLHNLLWLARAPPTLNHLRDPTAVFLRSLQRKLDNLEMWIMASKNTPKPNAKNFAEISFLNIKITGKHKDDFNTWMSRKDAEISLDVAAFMSNGHKTSITWDDNNKCFIVSATCKESSSPNVDCCITSRSAEWWEAMCMNVYKNDVMCNKGSWRDQQEDTDWG